MLKPGGGGPDRPGADRRHPHLQHRPDSRWRCSPATRQCGCGSRSSPPTRSARSLRRRASISASPTGRAGRPTSGSSRSTTRRWCWSWPRAHPLAGRKRIRMWSSCTSSGWCCCPSYFATRTAARRVLQGERRRADRRRRVLDDLAPIRRRPAWLRMEIGADRGDPNAGARGDERPGRCIPDREPDADPHAAACTGALGDQAGGDGAGVRGDREPRPRSATNACAGKGSAASASRMDAARGP